jgi:hypothetical protein
MADGRQSCILKGYPTVDTKKRQNRELKRDVQAPKPPIHSQLSIIYVRYVDHVVFHRADPESLTPQVRECVGWLLNQSEDFVTISWDRYGGTSTLEGGSRASGVVIMRNSILEMRTLV